MNETKDKPVIRTKFTEKDQFHVRPIKEDEQFTFSCYPGVSCFNECCHDIDVILTPFDIVRMKNRLGIRSDEFLARYVLLQKFKDTDLPLAKLNMIEGNKCPFVRPEGCSVYENRPVVCRNYPMGIATQNPIEGESDDPYFIIEEDMCKGHFEQKKWTIPQWKNNQGASDLDELNKPWLEMVARLKSLTLKDDQDQKINIFIMVSYDLDAFRSFVFNSSFLTRFNVDDDTIARIESDDEKLLKFGFEWLRFVLFAEGSMKPAG